MYIKCCGFKDKHAVETAVKFKTDAIGFVTYKKSKRYVTNLEIKSLTELIPKHIDRVAVVVNLEIAEISELIETTSINTIQFHGDENLEFIKIIKDKYPFIKVFKALPANNELEKNIYKYKGVVDKLLIDTPSKLYGGTGETYNWKLLEPIRDVPYLIAGGLNLERIKALEKSNLHHLGYDISSGIETKDVKDINKIKNLLSYLKG